MSASVANEADGAGTWSAVRLTEARQVSSLLEQHRDDWPAPEVGVAEQFATLRTSGQVSAALDYLAHALPRLEAVAWAIEMVEAAPATPSPSARHALACARRWWGERSDAHRRAAGDAAEAIGRLVPERFLGQAIYYSGGSIAAPDQPPLWPPENIAARYVSGAIDAAARQSDDPRAFLTRALDLGEEIARRGLQALGR